MFIHKYSRIHLKALGFDKSLNFENHAIDSPVEANIINLRLIFRVIN